MDSVELLARAKRFALDSLAFYRRLSKAPEAQVPGVQFYKAATSAWMNYRSSKRGKSRPDFISKLGIAVEEIDETVGWLEFMDGRASVQETRAQYPGQVSGKTVLESTFQILDCSF
jgi:four helix bundle protein